MIDVFHFNDIAKQFSSRVSLESVIGYIWSHPVEKGIDLMTYVAGYIFILARCNMEISRKY